MYLAILFMVVASGTGVAKEVCELQGSGVSFSRSSFKAGDDIQAEVHGSFIEQNGENCCQRQSTFKKCVEIHAGLVASSLLAIEPVTGQSIELSLVGTDDTRRIYLKGKVDKLQAGGTYYLGRFGKPVDIRPNFVVAMNPDQDVDPPRVVSIVSSPTSVRAGESVRLVLEVEDRAGVAGARAEFRKRNTNNVVFQKDFKCDAGDGLCVDRGNSWVVTAYAPGRYFLERLIVWDSLGNSIELNNESELLSSFNVLVTQ